VLPRASADATARRRHHRAAGSSGDQPKPTTGALERTFTGAGHRTQLEAAMPTEHAYPHQNGTSPDREAGRRQAWSDPQNPYTTARLLIARHAEAAGDCAAEEMAHAQAVGDAGDYDSWAEIYDAVAVLQASPARTSGP
jgi:hypothetical protein